MVTAARDRLAKTLRGDVKSAFSADLTARLDDLSLEIEGLGRVKFPVTPATARKIIGLGQPARFGRGEETLTDPEVRHTWEIPKHLVGVNWNEAALKEALLTIKEDLGLPNAAETPLLRLDNLGKRFGTVKALKDVSLELPAGKTLAIVGESGSGKSTLAKAAIQLLAADEGKVYVGDLEFSALKGGALRRARRRIQMIFQDPFGSLNPRHRVGDVIARAGKLGGLSAAKAKARALELLEIVGLPRDDAHISRRMTYYYAFNARRYCHAVAPAVPQAIIEAGYLTNPLDQQTLIGDPDRAALGIARGVETFLADADRSLPATLPKGKKEERNRGRDERKRREV